MNEQTKAIIDRARRLLAAATPGEWVVDSDACIQAPGILSDGTRGAVHVADFTADENAGENADVAAFAVNNIGTLCDALERSRFALEWWAADRVDCLQRVEVMASAVQALGERCVLSVPPGDNLRVARMPRELGP